METYTQLKTDLIKVFAEASKRNDIYLIESLLDEKGEFAIQNSENDELAVGKQEFIIWYESKLESTLITDILFDNCLYCSMGKSVVLFNNGLFPRKAKDISERNKSGLMIDVKDEKIIEIKFCMTFAKTNNDFLSKGAIKKIIESMAPGLPYSQAYELVTGNKLISE